ncbi:MAG: TonB-dependent receptor, partial [Leptolyngbya sp. Prado105]|nr:TonB-dependent receptor [Leptolyngbya sp. Prado105]
MKPQFFLYVSLISAGFLLAPVQAQEIKPTSPSISLPDAVKPSPAIPVEVKPEAQTSPQSIPSAIALDEVKILSPAINQVLDVPAATVVIQAPEGKQVELRVNGVLVPEQLIGRTETQKSGQVIRTYYGVSLKQGSNTLSAQIVGTSQSAQVTVQLRGEFEKLSVQAAEAKIPADGRSMATIRGELLDAQGNRSNRDALITLSTTAGEFLDTDAAENQPGFQVKAERGQFSTRLRSGLEARTVTVRAAIGTLEDFTQLQFETNLRPSIATGVVDLRFGRQGTNFYKSFRDFLPVDADNNYQLDFGASFFATGRIGDWLLTTAYNSARPLNQTCDGTNGLFRPNTQVCDQNYSVYGDSSESTVLTPSIDSVFLRLERNSPIAGAGTDYAMWGDYTSEEFASRSQEFSAMTRQLHGFKANYNFGNLQVTGLFANNIQGFQRDTLVPDGTSGFYFLSRRLLIEGSESIFLELEELNRPGTVLKRQQLNRGTDYEIDYDRGTILFRQPIARTDVGEFGETLVRRIVSTYQYDTPGSDSRMFGGRVQYHLARGLNRESWLGATYLREDQGARDFELYGADAFVSLGQNAHALAEYARSTNFSDVLGLVSGSAYRFELEGRENDNH